MNFMDTPPLQPGWPLPYVLSVPSAPNPWPSEHTQVIRIGPEGERELPRPTPQAIEFRRTHRVRWCARHRGTVRYRYRTHDNATSPTYAVTFDGLHFWQREFGGGDRRNTLAAPEGKKPTIIRGFVQLEVLGQGNDVTSTDRAPFTLTCEPSGAPTRIKG